MEYRRLGHSGLQVSVIGLGTNNFGPRIDYPAAERVLRQAVDTGVETGQYGVAHFQQAMDAATVDAGGDFRPVALCILEVKGAHVILG